MRQQWSNAFLVPTHQYVHQPVMQRACPCHMDMLAALLALCEGNHHVIMHKQPCLLDSLYTPLLPHPPYQPAPLTAPASCLLTTPWVIWQPISHTAMTASLNAPSNLDPVSNWQISYTECDLCQISVCWAQIFNKHTMTISPTKCALVFGTRN